MGLRNEVICSKEGRLNVGSTLTQAQVGLTPKTLFLSNIQQFQKTNLLTELYKINKYFSLSMIPTLGTYLSYKIVCWSPEIHAKLCVLHFPCSPPHVTACSRRCYGDSASRSSILKEPKLILAQMTPAREGPGALSRPHPRGAAATVGTAGLVSEEGALRTLVLVLKGPSPEGKRPFRSEFINQAGPVV